MEHNTYHASPKIRPVLKVVNIDSYHGWSAADSKKFLGSNHIMRSSTCHPKRDFEGVFSRNPAVITTVLYN